MGGVLEVVLFQVDSYKFSYKFTLSVFWPFVETKKRESNVKQFAGLVTKIISVFCL